jgi:hypothetical protein
LQVGLCFFSVKTGAFLILLSTTPQAGKNRCIVIKYKQYYYKSNNSDVNIQIQIILMLVNKMIEVVVSFIIGMFGTYTVLDLINKRNNTIAAVKRHSNYVKR